MELSEAAQDEARLASLRERTTRVGALLRENKLLPALQEALVNPPLQTKRADIKVRFAARATTAPWCSRPIPRPPPHFFFLQANTAALVFSVMAKVPEANIAQTVTDLPLELCDTLMKYVYRALSSGHNQQPACPTQPQLFKWHAELVRKAGLGSIVRVISEKYTV